MRSTRSSAPVSTASSTIATSSRVCRCSRLGFCHYGNQTFFDENGKPTEQASAVETLAGALKFGAVVFNLHLIGQAIGIIKDSLEHEQAFKETAKSLLKLGVEKIDDHNMEMHYLARLNTKLPPE